MSAMDVPIDRPQTAAPPATLGDDGGAVCANPNSAVAIISVYCPDQRQKFQEYEDKPDTAEVAG